jgi:putative Holliday junction resolvase
MANLLGLDVGTVRIGVAAADTVVPLAIPLTTLDVDGSEVEAVQKLIKDRAVDTIVVGYPRNQSGDPTDQTAISEAFANKLKDFATVVFQDESVTSVMAEDRLKAMGKPYTKADIDMYAAMIILQDYLEANYAA